MLRHVYIIKEDLILYERNYGKSLDRNSFMNFFSDIKRDALSSLGSQSADYSYFKYRIIYNVDKERKLFVVFITGLTDSVDACMTQARRLLKEFLGYFEDLLDLGPIDPSMLEVFNPSVDKIHRALKPKISLVGFSGVGKTTTTRLIKAEEIPTEHIPTITGDIATIKIGKLQYNLWDFAGQEQFSYIWGNFIKGSDAVLLITDSSLENVEKSKFFLELIKSDAPNARSAAIGNKQDLPSALPIDKIEEILGIKTYAMVAVDPNNREKMIQIIADVLEINPDVSSLLKPIYERDQLINEAQQALQNGDILQALDYFEKLYDLCLEMGDDIMAREFSEKAEKLRGYLK